MVLKPPKSQRNLFSRIFVFAYGVICYAICVGTMLYACGFLANVIVPRSIDSPPVMPLSHAWLVDLALLVGFSLQHSGMARPSFKKRWTQVVPTVVERSTYVLCSSVCLLMLFHYWQPMGGILWQVTGTIPVALMYGLCGVGWLTVLSTTFLINHFDLFGLRQVWLYLWDQNYTELAFVTPGLYKVVRHPLYLGFLLAFWATPTMTVAHLLFALGTTIYMLGAVQLEERDLRDSYGDAYKAYSRQVPMLIPFLRR